MMSGTMLKGLSITKPLCLCKRRKFCAHSNSTAIPSTELRGIWDEGFQAACISVVCSEKLLQWAHETRHGWVWAETCYAHTQNCFLVAFHWFSDLPHLVIQPMMGWCPQTREQIYRAWRPYILPSGGSFAHKVLLCRLGIICALMF